MKNVGNQQRGAILHICLLQREVYSRMVWERFIHTSKLFQDKTFTNKPTGQETYNTTTAL